MSDVFVSYASADREKVAQLVQRLEQLGFSVWWDRDIAHGQNFHRVIEQALDQAKCAIVVWSQQSIGSEWVVNEASSAHKRHVLVPVLIEAVEPPLAFRHLQSADLRNDNPNEAREYQKLERSVRQIVGASASAPTHLSHSGLAGSFWQSPIGWAVGAGVLLLGVAALLAALKQIGWLNTMPSTASQSGAPSQAPPSATEATTQPAIAPEVTPSATAPAPAPNLARENRRAAGRVNLLDPENGAQIVAAAEEYWRRILESKKPVCSSISGQSFATIGLRKEQPTTFATLAVYVDSAASYNLKKLALYTADAEHGPFKKIDEFEIPNYKNMRGPFHEFKFAPVTARFVKLKVESFYHGDGPNGYVCSMQLYGPQ